jgi:hypothetical protein
MKFDALRKEDEIPAKPVTFPTMQQVVHQDSPRPKSREATLLRWPTAQTLRPPGPVYSFVGSAVKSGVQKKEEVAFTNRRREGNNWDRYASRTFQLPMKVTDRRTEVDPRDVPTYQPDYLAPAQGTTAMKFAKLPTSAPDHPVAIRVALKGQTVGVTIASNSSPSGVEDKARLIWGQAVKFVEPPPITWTPNKVCHFQTVTGRLCSSHHRSGHS